MNTLFKNILLTIMFLAIVICSIQPAKTQERVSSQQVYSSIENLPYASTYYSVNSVKRTTWKVTSSYPTEVNVNNYIKKPYHNPNLIKELEAKKKLEEQQKAELARQKEQEYQNQLRNMCVFSYQTRRNRRAITYAGVHNVRPNTVMSRQVVPFNDFRDACIGLYKEHRLIRSTHNSY